MPHSAELHTGAKFPYRSNCVELRAATDAKFCRIPAMAPKCLTAAAPPNHFPAAVEPKCSEAAALKHTLPQKWRRIAPPQHLHRNTLRSIKAVYSVASNGATTAPTAPNYLIQRRRCNGAKSANLTSGASFSYRGSGSEMSNLPNPPTAARAPNQPNY